MQALLKLTAAMLCFILAFLRSRSEQAVVELALRQQLVLYSQTRSRPRLTSVDRAFWVALRHLWPCWKEVLVIVKPETVVRWHRNGFWLYWCAISQRGPGQPRISPAKRLAASAEVAKQLSNQFGDTGFLGATSSVGIVCGAEFSCAVRGL